MKVIAPLLVASVALFQNAPSSSIAAAQRTKKRTAATHGATTAAHGCVKVPDISPKIPALAAAATCPKALYTLSSQANIKIDYVSPEEGTALPAALGIEPVSFSLAYVDTKIGSGELAQPHKYYTIHYTGYLVDGTKFDSSYDHDGQEPFTFLLGEHQVIPGWDTGFAGMRVGGKRRLFIPFQLAYGPQGRGAIPPRAELIFDVEFLKQSEQAPPPKATPTPPPAAQPGFATPPPPAQPATAAPPTATPPRPE